MRNPISINGLYDRYERILRLDSDILITSKAPNIFDLVPEDKVGGVYEDIGMKRFKRYMHMNKIADSFSENKWDRRYVNSGVIVASKKHRNIFLITDEDKKWILEGDLAGKTKEQNFLNWKVRKEGFEIFELDYRFNHLEFFSGKWNNSPKRSDSFIIHYAGSQQRKIKQIKKAHKKIHKDWIFYLGKEI